jgi:hypothetical protein
MYCSTPSPTRTARFYDTHAIFWKFRPPCPKCGRKTWPDRGLEEQEIFWCPLHGHWTMEPESDAEGDLPLVYWEQYKWRFGL